MLIGPGHAPISALVALALGGGLLTNIALRRNWARVALTVLAIAGLVFSIPVLPLQLRYGSLIAAAAVAQTVLQLIGIILLFASGSRDWFANRVTAPPAA